jgi:hypothetical protein
LKFDSDRLEQFGYPSYEEIEEADCDADDCGTAPQRFVAKILAS